MQMMTPNKQKGFRISLIVFAVTAGVIMYEQGAFESMDLPAVAILLIGLGLVAFFLYRYISDNDTDHFE